MFFKQKEKPLQIPFHTLESLTKLLRDFSATQEDFLDSFPYFLKLMGIERGSVYYFEKEKRKFLLKSWAGFQPSQFSLMTDDAFLKYLRIQKDACLKAEFFEKNHEFRQMALYLFQQTSSNTVYPILSPENEWLGLFCILTPKDHKIHPESFSVLTELYLQSVKAFMEYIQFFHHYKKLSELGKVKNELLSNVTHEFQTPLNAILGMTDAILSGIDGEISDELRDHVLMIQNSGKTLHATLSNVLQITQVEAGRTTKKMAKVNLVKLVNEVVSLYDNTLEEKQNRFHLPIQKDEFEAFVDAGQMKTVFMNLIGNAVKFTENGDITVRMKKSGEMIRMSIEDTGVGMDPKQLDLIFEEFYQGDGSKTREYGGTGLGLALVKKIITSHGGRVEAHSNKGLGSRFDLSIPVFPG